MKNRLAERFSFIKKAILASAGAVALLIPIMVGMLNSPVLHAESNHVEFEVASVRLAPPLRNGAPIGRHGGPGTDQPTRVTIYATTFIQLVMDAYDLPVDRVKPPAKFTGTQHIGDRFEIHATVPNGTSEEQYRMMLRNLLADRFHLKAHFETKHSTVFELTVGPRGHKLAEHGKPQTKSTQGQGSGVVQETPFGRVALPTDRTTHLRTLSGGRLLARNMSMAEFGKQIEPTLHAPVIDATGLTRRYDFRLDYDAEMTDGPSDQPRLPVAVQQQLGLRLRSKKGPVQLLVIDSVRKQPTAN